jgi:hypothetical protein
MIMKFLHTLMRPVALAAIALALAGCKPQPPDSQTKNQAITEAYASKLTTARPYPLAAMRDSAERANLTERLLRMNNPNKVGYVYELTQNGQILAHYVIKGKLSSTASQLTNTQNIVNKCIGYCPVAVDSMGDDGSYGPEEGGDDGVFFFTANGVLIEWNGLWLYSDAPMELSTPPLLTMNADAKPSTTAGILGSAPSQPPKPAQ